MEEDYVWSSMSFLTRPCVLTSLSFMRRYCTGRDFTTVTFSFGDHDGVRPRPLAPPLPFADPPLDILQISVQAGTKIVKLYFSIFLFRRMLCLVIISISRVVLSYDFDISEQWFDSIALISQKTCSLVKDFVIPPSWDPIKIKPNHYYPECVSLMIAKPVCIRQRWAPLSPSPATRRCRPSLPATALLGRCNFFMMEDAELLCPLNEF